MNTSSPDPVDVVVVGSGPAGSVVTHTLATRGFKVVCLEQGDWINSTDYPVNHPEWELLIQQQWAHDPNVRKLPADYPVDASDSDMSPIMYNAVGGGSTFYGAEWPRMVPSDFRVKTLDGMCDDWPISYRELAPDYEEVDRFIGVSGLGGDPAYPPGLDFPQGPHPLGKAGLLAAEAMNKLGWHWWPGTNAIPTQKIKLLAQCTRWGVCEWGCPEGSKASFDIAYLPHATRAGAKLITGARVRQVVTNAAGRADGVIWIDREGGEHLQRAGAVVLCANGVGTPRLLLLSSSPQHPDGLANSSGLVGRNLMLHPNCSVTGFYDRSLESWHGPAGQLIYSYQFYESDQSRGFVRGSKMHALPWPGILNTIETHRSLPYDELWGPAIHDVARSAAGGLLWAANIEDLPDPENRVTLSPALKDSDGLPAPKISYRISENTRRSLRFALARMKEAHEVVGAARTFEVELWIDQPGHLMGTARMGNDPATSVVDKYGCAHDCPNLFVADGSLFVTSGSANPTCTIAALALRVGKHIAATARSQEAQP
jgi:choline dehydrogenase-like flavoprotein